MGDYFKTLNYTLGNEDSHFEMQVLPSHSGHVVAVADCGSRLVPLLARAPRRLTAVDISTPQLALSELRIALLKSCDRTQYMGFLGYSESMNPTDRLAVFAQLSLPPDVSRRLREMLDHIAWEAPLYLGQFERMLITVSKINRTITGIAGQQIFDFEQIEDQLAYMKAGFPRRRWNIVVALLGNSTALNSLLYKGDFPRKNTDKRYYDTYRELFDRLFSLDLARKSFFLQMVFLGRIVYEEGLPAECDATVFEAAKQSLVDCKVQFVESDILDAVRASPVPVDFLSLSDVPSFFDDGRSISFLNDIRTYMTTGSLSVVRGHLRIVSPDQNGYQDVSERYRAIAARESTQLWTINTYEAI